MLRGQLDPEVLKLIPLRSVSLKMRMSPVPLSRRQTLDPDRTLASGKLSGSRCVLAAFHAHFTLEKSTVRVSGFADCMLLAWAVANPLPGVDINSNSNSASIILVVIIIVILTFNLTLALALRLQLARASAFEQRLGISVRHQRITHRSRHYRI